MLEYITIQLAPRAADELWNGADQVKQLTPVFRKFLPPWLYFRKDSYVRNKTNPAAILFLLHHWYGALLQMSTIWADTVDQARRAAREMVFAGLSDREDLYGLYDCWCETEQVKVILLKFLV